MAHSRLTQWIEEADGRVFCQDAGWKLGPAKTENIAAVLMNVAGLFFLGDREARARRWFLCYTGLPPRGFPSDGA
jgi:hypothetical protein